MLKNLFWIEELLPPETEAIPKHGGMAYYLDMKLMLILVEQPKGVHEHKGVSYPFELWNGLILPVEPRKHNAFFLKFPLIENHPANKNWLYMPADSDSFDEDVKQVLREIGKRNPLLGLPVKFKEEPHEAPEMEAGGKKKKRKKKKISKIGENNFLMSVLNSRKK